MSHRAMAATTTSAGIITITTDGTAVIIMDGTSIIARTSATTAGIGVTATDGDSIIGDTIVRSRRTQPGRCGCGVSAQETDGSDQSGQAVATTARKR